jgi:hypothetical protein
MAHAVSNATHAPKVEQSRETPQAPKPAAKNSPAPEDKATISQAGQAAQKSGKK